MNIGGTAFLTPCGNFFAAGLFFYGSDDSKKVESNYLCLKIKKEVAERTEEVI